MLTEREMEVIGKPFRVCVNVAQLLKEAPGSSRHYQIRELAIPEMVPMIDGEVALTRTQQGILVIGNVRTQVKVVCSRCLKLVDLVVSFDMEDEFFPKVDVISGLPVSLPDEPGSFCIDENHILDLSEAVRQYLLLAIPMKPLCQPDCAGLCPVCGSNLNQGTCSCSRRTRDQRWSKLEKFKFQKKE